MEYASIWLVCWVVGLVVVFVFMCFTACRWSLKTGSQWVDRKPSNLRSFVVCGHPADVLRAVLADALKKGELVHHLEEDAGILITGDEPTLKKVMPFHFPLYVTAVDNEETLVEVGLEPTGWVRRKVIDLYLDRHANHIRSVILVKQQ